jgi:hypothetical protein
VNTYAIAIDQESARLPQLKRDPRPREIGFQWDSLKIGGKAAKPLDSWKHRAIGVMGDSYIANVPAHGVVLLKVTN